MLQKPKQALAWWVTWFVCSQTLRTLPTLLSRCLELWLNTVFCVWFKHLPLKSLLHWWLGLAWVHEKQYLFIYITILFHLLVNKSYPLARPTTSFLSSHSCPGAYRPRSSTELLSPFVKNFMDPSSLEAKQIHLNRGIQNPSCSLSENNRREQFSIGSGVSIKASYWRSTITHRVSYSRLLEGHCHHF